LLRLLLPELEAGHLGLSSSAKLLVRLLQTLQVATHHRVFVVIPIEVEEDTVVGRYLKSLKQSYEQFGGAAQAKMTSLELGKKKSQQAKAAKAAKPSTEFVNPHPMATNNNVITASM
jgi:hypothetical protein